MICPFYFATVNNIIKSDSDYLIDANGRKIIKDSKDLWSEFQIVINKTIEREALGKTVPGGGTWNESWIMSINQLRRGNRENYKKYVDYIINSRKQKGLPDLKFHCNKKGHSLSRN